MTSGKSVLVIGAGLSGLTAIKACLEEGLSVTCYELSNDVGGLWKYREDDLEEVSSMFWNMYTNTSKEMSAFSDFPPPKKFPNYMHHTVFQQYIELYAENFHLKKKIKFQHKVLNLAPDESYESTGRWKVQVQDMGEGTKSTKEFVYDAVIVATGQNNFPVYPTIKGIEEFKGQTMHSRRYKKPEPFRDKRVLVYGFGNSALDIATDISKYAIKTYLSCQRTKWIIKRMGLQGQFSDAQYIRRCLELIRAVIPKPCLNYVAERHVNTVMNHDLLGLTPDRRLLDSRPCVSDTLSICILQGTVKLKSNIDRLTSDGVVFQGSQKVRPIDSVIFCTGYEMIFPFVGNDVIDVHHRLDNIYKAVFPIQQQHPSLAFVGLTLSDQASTVVSEMEARWVARVFNTQTALPPKESMISQNQKYLSELRSRFGFKPGHRHFPHVHCYPHVDDLASLIGVKPNLTRIALTDPKLFWKCFFGPCYAYQYRLTGPHSWDGAREAIFTAENRIRHPFVKTPSTVTRSKDNTNAWITQVSTMLFIIFFCYILFA